MPDDVLQDPAHLKSTANPCSWCGAKWHHDTPVSAVIVHRLHCLYIEYELLVSGRRSN